MRQIKICIVESSLKPEIGERIMLVSMTALSLVIPLAIGMFF